MRYRQRTNDFVDNGKVWDIYDIKTNKNNIPSAKKKARKNYKHIRTIKRSDGHYVLVRK